MKPSKHFRIPQQPDLVNKLAQEPLASKTPEDASRLAPAAMTSLETAKSPETRIACVSCRHLALSGSYSRCHRYPPQVISPQRDAADWPVITQPKVHCCGEYSPKL
jgi:hypothetical protein